MRRLTVIFLVLLIFILSGCGSSIKPQEKVTTNFKCDFTLTCSGAKYSGTAEFFDNESSCFTITSPKSISGLSLTLSGEEYIAQFADITYTGKISDIPNSNILTTLTEVLTSAEIKTGELKSDNDGFYTEGETDFSGYKLYYRADGFPQKLIFTDAEATLRFSNMSYAFK